MRIFDSRFSIFEGDSPSRAQRGSSSIRKSPRGFTLLEMLVASVVFMVLAVILLQLFGSLTATTGAAQARSEILRQTIGSLERVNYDLAGLVRTGGWDFYVIKGIEGRENDTSANEGSLNDSLIFLAPVASARPPADPRQLSLVRYGVDVPESGGPSLSEFSLPAFSRTVRPFGWREEIAASLPLDRQSVDSALADMGAQPIAPGVIRCEICFRLWDGSLAAEAPADPSRIRALIFGIVVVDQAALRKISQTQRGELAAQFPKAGAGQRPQEAWQGCLDQLPSAVRKTIRIYEQTISI